MPRHSFGVALMLGLVSAFTAAQASETTAESATAAAAARPNGGFTGFGEFAPGTSIRTHYQPIGLDFSTGWIEADGDNQMLYVDGRKLTIAIVDGDDAVATTGIVAFTAYGATLTVRYQDSNGANLGSVKVRAGERAVIRQNGIASLNIASRNGAAYRIDDVRLDSAAVPQAASSDTALSVCSTIRSSTSRVSGVATGRASLVQPETPALAQVLDSSGCASFTAATDTPVWLQTSGQLGYDFATCVSHGGSAVDNYVMSRVFVEVDASGQATVTQDTADADASGCVYHLGSKTPGLFGEGVELQFATGN